MKLTDQKKKKRSGSKLGSLGKEVAKVQTAAKAFLYHHLIFQDFGLGWVRGFYEYCMTKRLLWSEF